MSFAAHRQTADANTDGKRDNVKSAALDIVNTDSKRVNVKIAALDTANTDD